MTKRTTTNTTTKRTMTTTVTRPTASGVARILVAEDEARIASLLEDGLSANAFTTEVAGEADAVLTMVRSGRFDLVILDLELGGEQGLHLLDALREAGAGTPVIALGTPETLALAGAAVDDYVAKPFRFEELLARLRVLLPADRTTEPTLLRAGGVALDLRTRQAVVGGRAVDLSTREFALAEVLFRHAGEAVSRQQLLSQVWGYDFDPGTNIVDVYVGHLRRKLGKERIESVRGIGYRLVNAD
jgi:DNA-binding response OmpR family regulator